MLTLIAHHSLGRERVVATLTYHDHHYRPSWSCVVARATTELYYGSTVLEVTREVLAALLRDVDRQLADTREGEDRAF